MVLVFTGVEGFRFEEALRNCGWWGVALRRDRFGTERFLSSRGVTDLSWRTEATEGERDIVVLLGVDGLERGVLKGVRAGEASGRVADVFVVLLETFAFTFSFLNLSL